MAGSCIEFVTMRETEKWRRGGELDGEGAVHGEARVTNSILNDAHIDKQKTISIYLPLCKLYLHMYYACTYTHVHIQYML